MNRKAVGTACGKVILFGEHAVVYGHPAIAVPVRQVRARVTVETAPCRSGLTLVAADLGRITPLRDAAENDPLAHMVRLTLDHLGASVPDITLIIRSTIPIASGLGSGAAVSVAIVRALTAYLGCEVAPATVSQLVFEVEKLHHGTPSGIDNTVVAYEMPVFFAKGGQIETLEVGTPINLLIADTGVPSHTRVAVGDVRRGWKRDVARYEFLFEQIGQVTREARALIIAGSGVVRLGELMNRNHELLCQMDVSSTGIERLVTSAQAAGALGAKLSGAGRGGNVIVLVWPSDRVTVSKALRNAGAASVIEAQVVSAAG
jgi:mevalonate kinase